MESWNVSPRAGTNVLGLWGSCGQKDLRVCGSHSGLRVLRAWKIQGFVKKSEEAVTDTLGVLVVQLPSPPTKASRPHCKSSHQEPFFKSLNQVKIPTALLREFTVRGSQGAGDCVHKHV